MASTELHNRALAFFLPNPPSDGVSDQQSIMNLATDATRAEPLLRSYDEALTSARSFDLVPLLHGAFLTGSGHAYRRKWLLLQVLSRTIFFAALSLLLVLYLVQFHPNGARSLLRKGSSAMKVCTDERGTSSPLQSLSIKALTPGISLERTKASGKGRRKIGASNVKISAKIFQVLLDEGLLKVDDKALCLLSGAGSEETLALKRKGIKEVTGIDIMTPTSISNEKGNLAIQELEDECFDFAFTTMFDDVLNPSFFVAEIERTLKAGGIAAMHVSLASWRERFMSSETGHAAVPVTVLFRHSDIVFVSRVYSLGRDTVIVFKKNPQKKREIAIGTALQHPKSVMAGEISQELMLRYTPHHHVYVHVKMSYLASNTMVLFKAQTSKFLFDTLEDFSHGLLSNLVRPSEKNEGDQQAEGSIVDDLRFADWLKSLGGIGYDWVVVKMGVKGDEFKLVGRLVETGAIYLISEFYLVGNPVVQKNGDHTDFLVLIQTLRAKGVVVQEVK